MYPEMFPFILICIWQVSYIRFPFYPLKRLQALETAIGLCLRFSVLLLFSLLSIATGKDFLFYSKFQFRSRNFSKLIYSFEKDFRAIFNWMVASEVLNDAAVTSYGALNGTKFSGRIPYATCHTNMIQPWRCIRILRLSFNLNLKSEQI